MNRKVRLLLLTLIVGLLMAFVPGSAFAAAPQVEKPTLAQQSTAHISKNSEVWAIPLQRGKASAEEKGNAG